MTICFTYPKTQAFPSWQLSLGECSSLLTLIHWWQVSDTTHYHKRRVRPQQWHAHRCANTKDIFIYPWVWFPDAPARLALCFFSLLYPVNFFSLTSRLERWQSSAACSKVPLAIYKSYFSSEMPPPASLPFFVACCTAITHPRSFWVLLALCFSGVWTHSFMHTNMKI